MPAQISKYARSVSIELTEAEASKLDAICHAAGMTRDAFVKLVIADSLRIHVSSKRLLAHGSECDVVSLLRANSQKLETVSRVLELLSIYIPDAVSLPQTPAETMTAGVSS
jgi:hypothetical protein